MKSYERDVLLEGKAKLSAQMDKLDGSILKFFWHSLPLSRGKESEIPKFLRRLKVLSSFTDIEIWKLTKYLHIRVFSPKEAVFYQDDIGVGFYIIFDGKVEIWASSTEEIQESQGSEVSENSNKGNTAFVTTLEKGECFGELALIEEKNLRTATALAKSRSVLLGIFKPDLDDLILEYPVVGAKFLHAIALILAGRLSSIGHEVLSLKQLIKEKEST